MSKSNKHLLNGPKMVPLYSMGFMWPCAGSGRIGMRGSTHAMFNFNVSGLIICLFFRVDICKQLIL